jgi:hypothetical protein
VPLELVLDERHQCASGQRGSGGHDPGPAVGGVALTEGDERAGEVGEEAKLRGWSALAGQRPALPATAAPNTVLPAMLFVPPGP